MLEYQQACTQLLKTTCLPRHTYVHALASYLGLLDVV